MFYPLTPLRCLARAVELYGHKLGIVSGERRFTYSEFGRRCDLLAGALEAEQLPPAAPVAYLSFNTHQLLEGYFGVVQAGAVVMPLNVRLTAVELSAILNHSGTRILFYENDFAPLLGHFRERCPAVRRYISLDDEYEDFLSSGQPRPIDIGRIDENSIAELFYTSGSTGAPKGVALSHRTLYLHALSVSAVFHQDDSSVELHTIPLFHANGWGRPQSSTLMGARHVMVRRFDPATVLRLIESERATSMCLVPTMAQALLQTPALRSHDLGSVREIHLGGAASSPDLIRQLEAVFHCPVQSGYGLTETAPVASSARHKSTVVYRDEADRFRRLAMTGWAVPGIEMRVADENGRDVPRDGQTAGEILLRGDHVMEGYYREPEATEAAMAGGWFHTGDMAAWDEECYVRIVDRKKDIIISGGENISSIEVENALLAHPAVLECAVVAAPDERWGEVPVGFVFPKSEVAITGEELCDFLAPRLARFKWPRRWIFVESPLPKGGTGKILKRELRAKT